MVIKPTSWDECLKKEDLEIPPTPMLVPVRKFNEYDIEIVGEIISNSKLGLFEYPMFAKYPFFYGIALFKEFDQYVIILTSRNRGEWELENKADLLTDEKALELVISRGKDSILEEPEFRRLKLLYEKRRE